MPPYGYVVGFSELFMRSTSVDALSLQPLSLYCTSMRFEQYMLNLHIV